MERALIVVAHPDDEVLGMGGTIAKLSKKGIEIHLLIVTDGSSCQYKTDDDLDLIIKNKIDETKQASLILGIKTISYGGLPDMKLDTVPHTDLNNVIENAINKIKPDVVFTHFYGDINLDHQLVFKSVLVACRPTNRQSVKEIYCFDVPSSTEWNYFSAQTSFFPNCYVDITKYLDVKLSALSCYKTELREYPHPRSVQFVREMDQVEGKKVGIEAAERFVLIRQIID